MALTPSQMLHKVSEAGWTQQDMADWLQAHGHPTARQSHVSQIMRGMEPRYMLGASIRKLYIEVTEPDDEVAA
jgi:hypothetical protein